MKKYFRLLHSTLLAHVLPVLAITSGYVLLVRRVIDSTWSTLFFNNADSLVLPLVTQSLQLHQPFNWVFSSQLFLFPEAILYNLIALIINDFKIALIVNGLVTTLIFYVILYQIIKHVSLRSAVSRLFATFGSLFVIGLTFFEAEPVNNRFIAMPFFMTTYYYGVILSSLLALLLSFKMLPLLTNGIRSKKILLLFSSLTALSALATSSNPMYLLQFIAPLTAVVALAFLLRKASFKQSILLLAPQALGLVIGMLARKTIFKPYIAAEVTGYLHIDKIPASIERLSSLLKDALADSLQKFEVLAIMVICVAVFIIFIYLIVLIFKKSPTTNCEEFLPVFISSALGAVTPPLIIIGVILTGNSEFRYLLPVITFPLLSLSLVAYKLKNNAVTKRYIVPALAVMATVLFVCAIVIGKPKNSYIAIKDFYPDETRCLDEALKDSPYTTGVAQFWRARNLQLQSKEAITVHQISPNVARYDWMSNRSSYSQQNISFVIVDTAAGETQYLQPIYTQTVLNVLGTPAQTFSCNVFDIYVYPVGTAGNIKLNQILGTGK